MYRGCAQTERQRASDNATAIAACYTSKDIAAAPAPHHGDVKTRIPQQPL